MLDKSMRNDFAVSPAAKKKRVEFQGKRASYAAGWLNLKSQCLSRLPVDQFILKEKKCTLEVRIWLQMNSIMIICRQLLLQNEKKKEEKLHLISSVNKYHR